MSESVDEPLSSARPPIQRMPIQRMPMEHRRALRQAAAGFTLVELLVAVAVLSLVTSIVYGAFAGLESTREGVTRLSDRHRQGRAAMRLMSQDLRGAYLSGHRPFNESLLVVDTAFAGARGTPAYRLDFNTFSNRRFELDSKVSDQAEISYFGAPSTEVSGQVDLVRRLSDRIDEEPESGGRVHLLATDIDLFECAFLDPQTGQWKDEWDSTQGLEEAGRVPLQVRLLLMLNGGARRGAGTSRQPLRFMTKVSLAMRNPLAFGVQ